VQERIDRLSRVTSASITSTLPLVGDRWRPDIRIAERDQRGAQLPLASAWVVAPNFFRTMEIPLLQGRDFTNDNRKGRPAVVIINEALARVHFAG
jgi:hypothetical protein